MELIISNLVAGRCSVYSSRFFKLLRAFWSEPFDAHGRTKFLRGETDEQKQYREYDDERWQMPRRFRPLPGLGRGWWCGSV